MMDSAPTDAPAPAPTPDAAAPAPRRRSLLRLLAGLVLLALLALAAAGLWQQQQALQRQADELRRLSNALRSLGQQAEQLELRQSDLASAAQRNSGELAAFGQRIAQHDEIVGRLDQQLAGGRSRFQMAAVEQLLMLANDRLLLARDLRSALRALQEADARLAALRDPRLFNVREAIAEERAALMEVPEPDLAGVALRLSSLSARIDRLPLKARAPDHFEPSLPEPGTQRELPADADAWERLRHSVGEALRSLFTLRRREGPPVTLLAPQHEALVHQVLMLRVEAARVALLRGQSVEFRESCNAAERWLRQYFRAEDVAVQTALAELERLQALDIAPPLPEITRSLVLLRAHMEETVQ